MDRVDWYFRQLVREDELDLSFDQVQDRIEQAASQPETGFDGMIVGGLVSEATVPDLTVDVTGNAIGYTPEGKRLFWTDLANIDASEDDSSVSTVVATPGNSRIISIFVEFDEAVDDLRTDGFGSPVYFKLLASHRIFVVMSDEDVTPTPPPLKTDALLLCDITRIFGQTTFLNTDISVARREDFYRNEGGFRFDIVQGRMRDAFSDLHDDYNLFVDQLQTTTPAGAGRVGVSAYTSTPLGGSALELLESDLQDVLQNLIDDLTSNGASSGASKIGFDDHLFISSDNVQSAITELIDDLFASGTSPISSGAAWIGFYTYAQTPTGGVALTLPTAWVQDSVQAFVDQLVASAGSNRIGAAAETGSIVALPSPATLSVGTIRSQLKELIDYIETIRNTPFAASAVSYIPHDYVTSINVQAAIDELIDDLQSQAGGAGAGAFEIGYKGHTAAPFPDGATPPIANRAVGSVEATLDAINQELAKRAALSGANFIGTVSFAADTAFSATSPGVVRQFNFDAGDYFGYHKTSNYFTWFFQALERMRLHTGALVVNTGIISGPLTDSAPSNTVAAGPAASRIEMSWNDANSSFVQKEDVRIEFEDTGTGAGFEWLYFWFRGSLGASARRFRMDEFTFEPATADTNALGLNNPFQIVKTGVAECRWSTSTQYTPPSQTNLTHRHALNCVLAQLKTQNAAGAFASTRAVNIASVVQAVVGQFDVTLDQAVNVDAALIATGATSNIVAIAFWQTPGTVVRVETRVASTGAFTYEPFSLAVIGAPSVVP